jgi:hypothetical protein
MAAPTITFNSSTGSDTTRSGSAGQPGGGPVSGTAASFTGSVFTLDGSPSLAGLPTDGTAVIWVLTSTGRQFFTINAFNDSTKTVTVDDAPAGTASGLTWGLGGKRSTWDNVNSRVLFSADAKAGWNIVTETDQSLTSTIFCNVTAGVTNGLGPVTVRSDSTTKRVITQTLNTAGVFNSSGGGAWRFRYLRLITSTATSNNYGFTCQATYSLLEYCEIGDATNKWDSGIYMGGNDLVMINCEIHHAKTNHGVWNQNGTLFMYGCSVHDCVGDGIHINSGSFTIMFSEVWNTTAGAGTGHGIVTGSSATARPTAACAFCSSNPCGGRGRGRGVPSKHARRLPPPAKATILTLPP